MRRREQGKLKSGGVVEPAPHMVGGKNCQDLSTHPSLVS